MPPLGGPPLYIPIPLPGAPNGFEFEDYSNELGPMAPAAPPEAPAFVPVLGAP